MNDDENVRRAMRNSLFQANMNAAARESLHNANMNKAIRESLGPPQQRRPTAINSQLLSSMKRMHNKREAELKRANSQNELHRALRMSLVQNKGISCVCGRSVDTGGPTATLSCGHTFHRECLKQIMLWVGPMCPTCRIVDGSVNVLTFECPLDYVSAQFTGNPPEKVLGKAMELVENMPTGDVVGAINAEFNGGALAVGMRITPSRPNVFQVSVALNKRVDERVVMRIVRDFIKQIDEATAFWTLSLRPKVTLRLIYEQIQ